uniref:Uncharacterized protein n=1 Tax=Megaselia scalaris TaxID=36166 RepID=T1GEP0_MEGSC
MNHSRAELEDITANKTNDTNFVIPQSTFSELRSRKKWISHKQINPHQIIAKSSSKIPNQQPNELLYKQ